MKLFITMCLIGMSLITKANETINLTPHNHVLLRNEVSGESVDKLSKELAGLITKRGVQTYPIYIVLDSPGGSIDAGLNFIEFAKTIPNVQTITIFSASMASGIVEALPGKRNILETGILMFHRAKGGVQGQFESGEMESRLNFYKDIVRSMEVTNASRMGLALSTYKAQVKDELWLYGSNAVAKKGADAVVNIVCSEDLIKATTTENFLIMGLFKVTVKFSQCPLLRTPEVTGDQKGKSLYLKIRRDQYASLSQ